MFPYFKSKYILKNPIDYNVNRNHIFNGGSNSLFKPEHQKFLDNIGIDKSNSFKSSDKSLIYYNDNIVVKIYYPSININQELDLIYKINYEEILVNEIVAYNNKLPNVSEVRVRQDISNACEVGIQIYGNIRNEFA